MSRLARRLLPWSVESDASRMAMLMLLEAVWGLLACLSSV